MPAYLIQSGDTLPQLARRLLGEADQWWLLAEVNQLAYPFVDTSGATYPGQKVLGVGDTLLIPDDLASPLTQRIDTAVTDDELTIVLGTDLRVLESGDLQEAASSGDWRTLAGLVNLRQALRHRLLTRKGELAYHPEYGSNLEAHLGQPLDELRLARIRLEVVQTLLQDPRIRAVTQIQVEGDAQAVTIQALCQVITLTDPLAIQVALGRPA